jgi:two-component system cell cycle response regulator CtrA
MRILLAAGIGHELEFLRESLLQERKMAIDEAVGLDARRLAQLAKRVDNIDAFVLAQPASGTDVLKAVRAIRDCQPDLPIVLLGSRRERLPEAYQAGADEFLLQPVWVPELLCRLDTLVRRRFGFAESYVQIGSLQIFFDDRLPLHEGQLLQLEPTVAEVLRRLAVYGGRVVTRPALHAALYESRRKVGLGAIKVHICRLRQQLAAAGIDASLIETVGDTGYRLRLPGSHGSG